MLKKLFKFKPKWQHSKVEVRQQAVTALKSNQGQILQQVATTDEAPQVRCIAVRKMTDMRLLDDIRLQTEDKTVKEAADKRYLQLLMGQKTDAVDLTERLQCLQALDNAQWLETLAVSAKEPELRTAALAKVERESLCGDIAQSDPVADIRLQAASKIQRKSTLERVLKSSRSKDKQVFRQVREKLDALLAAEEGPKRWRSEQEETCKQLELLLRTAHWNKAQKQLQHLAEKWQASEAEATHLKLEKTEADAQRAKHFTQMQQESSAAWEAWQQQKQAQTQTREAQQAILDELKQLQQRFQQQEFLEAERVQEQEAHLETLLQRWKQAGQLVDVEQQKMDAQCHQAQNKLHHLLKNLLHARSIGKALEKLCEEAEQQNADKQVVTVRGLDKLRRSRRAIEHLEAPNHWLQTLEQRFNNAVQALEKKLQEQQSQRKHHQKEIQEKLKALEAALQEGQLQTALALEHKVRHLLALLADLPPKERKDWEKRFHACSAQVHELRGWQRWGNKLERETLCQQVEALIGMEADPEELATRIRNAQATWKKLKDGRPHKTLWKRFNDACQKAYAPCQVHFEQQAQSRHQHYELRAELCAELEKFEQNNDWGDRGLDWKAAWNFVKVRRKTWYQIGATDRKQRKPLNDRFEAALAALDKHLDRERKRNFQQRKQLVEKTWQLQEKTDIREAINEVKDLQSQWLISVPSGRKEENALWDAFRAACDAVFDRRKQEQDEFTQSLNANLKAREAICLQLQQWLEAENPDWPHWSNQQHKLQAEWNEIGTVPKKVQRSIEQQFSTLNKQAQQAYYQWQNQQQHAQWDLLKQKAGLCRQLEALALSGEAQDAAQGENGRTAIEQSWQALPALENRNTEQAISARFQAAQQHDASIQETAQDQQRQLCIQMELLSGMASPEEDAERRMQYQVERLSKTMGAGGSEFNEEANATGSVEPAEKDALIRQFYLIASMNDDLDTRFEKAVHYVQQ
ncbi:DUF349 domain-containing protein [Candidatus Venteria ishoeyi]|uniref:DUF349 domain-containing protein n=1 Tax=Candidatus Venteria ishoeyi TaxID=1899563 RepID=UPI0025A55CE0|nr:DUF349 domain-containing protein [Candidatus Venteria ishoeyi]MDM8547708.1 DUF349 domain-containing protein [Candidatus Venteria ishoeyi]